MGKIIQFAGTVPMPVFKEAENGIRVLLSNGLYSEAVAKTDMWSWMNDHMDSLSPRVFEAISKAERVNNPTDDMWLLLTADLISPLVQARKGR